MSENTETIISINPDNESTNLIPQTTDTIHEPPIFNNTDTTEVILLDISPDKRWTSYITHQREDHGVMAYKTIDGIMRTYLTRRRFTAINPAGNEETVVDNLSAERISLEHFSLEITADIKNVYGYHCKFLSISGDGKYIVLSFCERINRTEQGFHDPDNPNCLVYKINGSALVLSNKLKCDGRAVFLNKNMRSLALIQSNTIEVYDNFPKNESISFLFDLHPFVSTDDLLHECVRNYSPYIDNAPWIDINKPNPLSDNISDDIERIITFSRHIRHNVLTTPFIGGIVRVWSILKDGERLTSFSAPKQHVMAFSKHYKYTAAYIEGTRSVNIYNVKSGLLVYHLESQAEQSNTPFEVAHIRFCYDGRYLAMSGWEGDNVVFEVWYIEAEESIYRTTEPLTTKPNSKLYKGRRLLKTVQPFVMRGITADGKKCLKGFYTSLKNNQLATSYVELDIDTVRTDIDIVWESSTPVIKDLPEILNNLNEFHDIKCGHFSIKGKKYLIRFGRHTVQLWRLNQNDISNQFISDKDDLIYIRAYKGPHYGIDYSFRETWQIQDFSMIMFIGGSPSGRMLVNIVEKATGNSSDQLEPNIYYHTEENFLPLHELLFPSEHPTRRQSCQRSLSSMQFTGESVGDVLKFDYHKLESACQALHYLSNNGNDGEGLEPVQCLQYQTNHKTLSAKTESLIITAVKNIDVQFNFFSTIAGSRTLAMLASFKLGREIIKEIVVQSIPISIFSYPKTISRSPKFEDYNDREDQKRLDKYAENNKRNACRNFNDTDSGTHQAIQIPVLSYRDSLPRSCTLKEDENSSIASNENVLTVLIEELSYDMYQLLFNRILSDSKKLGPGCLSSLTDALLLLQAEGNIDLLLSSSQKLSYLEIEKNKLGVLESEINYVIRVKTLKKEYVSRIRNLETQAIMEQIQTYSYYQLIFYKIRRLYCDYYISSEFKKDVGFYYRVYIRNNFRKLFKKSRNDPKKLSKVCVVPLPHFNSYSSFPEDRPRNYSPDNVDIITYKDNSAFVRLAIDQDSNSIFRQGDTVLEVMLEYKWRQFARWRFVIIYAIHLIYYVSYSTGVLFSQELYDHDPDKDFLINAPGQIISVALMGLSIFVLLAQEIRQFWKTQCRLDYFTSCYNWIDIASFVFPMITLLQLIYRWDYFNEVCSVSTLILWTHGILRLRVISYFGITLETIIQLCRNVASVLLIMMLVIFAFSNAYIVLLRSEPDNYFQEQYKGTFTSVDNSISGETSISNVSSDNGFRSLFKTLSQVWFFVFGVWDSLQDGEAGDNKVLICISIVFSFITVLIFFNLVIALMSSTIEDVNKLGKKVWVSHFAAVISEIELLWCLDDSKRRRKNNPMYIYYIASYDSVLKHEELLREETEELEKKLGIDVIRQDTALLI